MIEIPIIYMDFAAIVWMFAVGLFMVDWTLSGKEYYGEYVQYRGIPFPQIWFVASVVGLAFSFLWLVGTHWDLIVNAIEFMFGAVKFV